jgi:8-oxo-dGTP pyrophosphatase MutT (NUDIX family)
MAGKILLSTPFFNIEELADSDPINGLPYYRLNGPDSVICCVINEVGDFMMVKQLRPNLNMHTVEFAAGEIDSGETPFDAAKREIREELGLNCQMIYLGNYLLMMNRTNIKNHLYFCISGDMLADHQPEKGIEKVILSRQSFKSLISQGDYFQLAGLGILQLASLHLNVDVLNDPIDKIKTAFNKRCELA